LHKIKAIEGYKNHTWHDGEDDDGDSFVISNNDRAFTASTSMESKKEKYDRKSNDL
jgi:hypothetical protein